MPLTTTPYVRDLNSAWTRVKDLLGFEKNPITVFSEYGTVHNCNYDVKITIPANVIKMLQTETGTSVTSSTLAERLNYYCTEVYLPATSILSTPIRVGGEKIEIPYDREYGELQTSFYIEGGYQTDGGMTYNVFHAWFDSIFPSVIRTLQYPEDYTTTIEISLYTTPDSQPLFGSEQVVKVTLYEAWPASIQTVPLSGRSGSEAAIFGVTWKYRYLIIGKNSTGDTSIVSSISDLIKNGFRIARSVQGIWNDAKSTYNSVKKAWNSITDIF